MSNLNYQINNSMESTDWKIKKKQKHKPKYAVVEEHIERTIKEKNLYTINKDIDFGNDKYLSSPWTVWVHKNECTDWSELSYKNIYTIDSIGTFWRFFNNFHLLDKLSNNFFIMKNQIKPIWEDNENRTGGIYSVKLDTGYIQNDSKISCESMISLCLLIMNETMISKNNEINGISYGIKNKSTLIKVWYKNYDFNIIDYLPVELFNQIDTVLKGDNRSSYKKGENKISIQIKPIKPDF